MGETLLKNEGFARQRMGRRESGARVPCGGPVPPHASSELGKLDVEIAGIEIVVKIRIVLPKRMPAVN